jgi:hypothetical protein
VKAQKSFSARNAVPLGILSVLVVLSLIFGAFPFGAIAAEGAQPDARNVEGTRDGGSILGATISNGTVSIGVHDYGNLVDENTALGLVYVPTGGEAISPGCWCEGWGAGDAVSGQSGWASWDNGGFINVNLLSFVSDATTAESVVEVAGIMNVTHDFHPSPDTEYLYEVEVTLENISASTVEPLYRRAMDWDIPPTWFAEYVTLQTGTAANIIYTSDDGFAFVDPFAGPSWIDFEGEAIDSGPNDHGALFDFAFDPLAPGESFTFYIYYGAAGTEVDADGALAAISAEAYSYGQPSSAGGPDEGIPNTFIFAFSGVGGQPIFPGVELDKTVGTEPGVCATTDEITVTEGDEVYYCYTVENTGGVTLTLHTLEDSELGTLLLDFSYELVPSDTLSIIEPATIFTDTVNEATWTAYNPGTPDVVSSTDVATVTVVAAAPAIELDKTVGTEPDVCATTDEIEIFAGDEVYYCYTVENTGDVTLTLHTLEDSELGTLLEDLAYDLGPGDTASVIQPAVIWTDTVNTALWTAYNPGPSDEVSSSDVATVTVIGAFYYIPQIEHLDNSVSSIQLVNIGDAESEVEIRYFAQDGIEDPVSPVTDTVGAGETNVYFPTHPASPFDGSVIVAYTGEVAAISNFLYLDPPIQSSYQGFAAGGPVVVFPLIMVNNNSNYTLFNVQNTTGDPVDIVIEFIAEPGMGYADIMSVTDTLPAWAAHTYDQSMMPEFASVGQWVGSARATVVGDGEIAGVAQQIDSLRGTGTAYTGFLRGSAQVETPLIMKENNGMFTSINCQNLSAMTDTISVTVEFFPEFGYPAMAPETVTDVPQYGTAVFLQYGGDQWVGAARVTNDKGEPLACVVNQLNLGQHYASAYQGFDAALTSDRALAPLVQFQDQGDGMNLWTSVNIQNLDTVSTTMVTMDYKPGPGYADIPDQTVDIEPGAVGVFLFYDPNGDGSNSIGGAEIFSDNGAPLAVVVNQTKLGFSGDIYSTYNGFAR